MSDPFNTLAQNALRIDFYLLNSSSPEASLLFACRFLEKAYRQGHRVFVHCDSQQQAESLDERLWTFKKESFIPHHLQGEGPEPPPPVQIGFGPEPRGFSDLLLNLAKTIPSYFSRFRRIAEIVADDETAKTISREHYKEYRKRGCELHTHKLEV